MENNINFKGAFLIKKATPQLKEVITPSLGKHSQIFENFTNNGDALYIVKSNKDRAVADVILGIPNIKFKYFPTLSTSSGFDTEKTQKAIKLLKSASNDVITTKDKLLAAIRKPINIRAINIKRIQEKNLKSLQKKLFIDFSGKEYKKNIDIRNGVCTIKTTTKDTISGSNRKHTLLEITPPGKYGICFATYVPISTEQNVRKMAIRNGEVIFEYTAPISETFDRNVALAKQHYIEQLNK